MFKSVINALIPLIEIANLKEGRKYINKLKKLKRDYYYEENGDNDHAVLDNLEFELFITSEAISSDIKKQKA